MAHRKCANWLSTYLKYTEEQESPVAFHQWTAISILSAAIGRHVFLDRGYYTIFPNLFVILVAGSAKCRKSMATHIGIELLRSMKSPPLVFSQKITNEALIGALTEAKLDNQCAGIIYASELSVFMGVDAANSGLIPTLTDLYDSPAVWSYHTKGRGVEEIRNVSVGMLAASTKEWLRLSIKADAVGGGFTSRIIFVYQDKPKRPILFPRPTHNHLVLQEQLLSDLNHIREQRGPMDLTPDAKDYADSWYREEQSKARDPKLEGYFGRKHDTMFKLAMVLSLAESDEKWITPIHVSKALELLAQTEPNLEFILSSVTASQIGDDTEKVLGVIQRAGTIRHSELLRLCWRFSNAVEMSSHIRTLVESGLIKEALEKDNRTRIYTAN